MTNAVILVPWRSDGKDGRREKLYAHVQKWLIAAYPQWPICEGQSPEGPFNRGAAINDASRRADELAEDKWEIAIIHDSDTVADPNVVWRAVERAQETGGTVYPYSTYTYCDRASTNKLLEGSSWFVAPEHHQDGFTRSVRYHHVSGIQVIHRDAYEAIGGYVELCAGWGAEDQIVNVMLNTYSQPPEWLEGGAFHLWHPAKRNDPNDELSEANHQTLAEVSVLAGRPMELRDFLAKGGHVVP
jgi:hypothetical protein